MEKAFIIEQNAIQKGMNAGKLLLRGLRTQVMHMKMAIANDTPVEVEVRGKLERVPNSVREDMWYPKRISRCRTRSHSHHR